MSDELGDRRRLQQFFAEVHTGETPPPFKELIRSPERQRLPIWKWATAVALGFALLGGWALRDIVWNARLGAAPPASAELALARSLSKPEAPLDFLLVTPGSNLLAAPPRLTGDWYPLSRIESEQGAEGKEKIR